MHPLLAIVLGFMVAVFSGLQGWTTYTCAMDGHTRLTCCCVDVPSPQAACADGSLATTAQSPGGCCDIHHVTIEHPEQMPAADFVAAMPADGFAQVLRTAYPAARTAHAWNIPSQYHLSARPTPPPAYIRYCSLLT
jgi:hypothetical protein